MHTHYNSAMELIHVPIPCYSENFIERVFDSTKMNRSLIRALSKFWQELGKKAGVIYLPPAINFLTREPVFHTAGNKSQCTDSPLKRVFSGEEGAALILCSTESRPRWDEECRHIMNAITENLKITQVVSRAEYMCSAKSRTWHPLITLLALKV